MRIPSTQLYLAILASAALTASACDSGSIQGPDETGIAVIEGHLDHDSGNQSTTPRLKGSAAGSADLQANVRVVEVNTIGARGALTAIATAQVAADGSFRGEGLTLPSAPLIVTGKASVAAAAHVLAIIPASDADRRVSPPLSQETTVEARAFLALVVEGRAPASIDAVSLMTWISADLAASASAKTDVLAKAWLKAQAAWSSAANSSDSAIPQAAARARLDAYAVLSVALDGAADADAEAHAWSTFMRSSTTAVQSQTSLSASVLADADAAAAMVFAHQVGAGIGAEAEAHANGVGAVISGYAAMNAQVASQGSGTASAAIAARLEAAYDGYFTAIQGASSAKTLATATTALGVALTGRGAGRRDGAVLKIVMNGAASGSAAVSTQVEAAFVATAAASATFDVSAGAALAAGNGAQLGTALVNFRQATHSVVTTSFAGTSTVGAFVTDVAVQLGGQARVQFGLDGLLAGVAKLGVKVSGSLIADLGLQSGADALVTAKLTGTLTWPRSSPRSPHPSPRPPRRKAR